MKQMRRFDRVELRPSVERTDEGYLKGEAIVTRTGIFLYKNPDGSIRRELRHPRDVFSKASLDTLKMIPIVMGHPDSIFVTAENAKDLQVGTMGETVYPDGDYVIVSLVITDAEAIKAVEQGRKELSLGYGVMHDDLDGGEWEGKHYDVKQINIHYNHLAIVSEARAGAMARLNLDQNDAYQTDSEEEPMPEKLKTIVLDNISYEAAPEVINALQREKKRADDLEKEKKEYIEVKIGDETFQMVPIAAQAVEKLQGEKDGLQEKLDAAQKQSSPEELHRLVKERQRIVDAAHRVVDEDTKKKLDDMTDADIMKEVVIQSAQKEKQDEIRKSLNEAKEGYVQGRFEQVIDTLPEKKSTIADQREKTTNEPRGNDKDASGVDRDNPDADKARQRYIDGLTEAYKQSVTVGED